MGAEDNSRYGRLAVRASAVRLKAWRSAAPLYNIAVREGVRRVFPPARGRDIGDVGNVRVVGLLTTATGIGQSARLCAGELSRDGFEVSLANLSKVFGVDSGIPLAATGGRAAVGPDLSIYHLNPPLILLGMIASGLRTYYRSPAVAYWAWELPELPPEWVVALRYVQAVLTPSTFCADIIRRHTDKPVLVVPHPVAAVDGRDATWRAGDEGRPFRVLSIFNCGSSLYRKNPMALIEAFKLAFGRDAGAELVLKVSDGRAHQADMAHLRERIGNAPNIRIVDRMMTEPELDQLIRSADVVASLHRSEGFGLSVAEAIMRGVPVVVTDWSGTADFCPPQLAYTVGYQLVAVDDPHPAYCHIRAARWAEPSIEEAAGRLREVRSDPAEAWKRAAELRSRLVGHIAAHRYGRAIASLDGRCTAVGEQRPANTLSP
ncbi:MAG: glycosyltransferase family 4 protein [Hyphomicrobiaceae bacterium]